jgi:hypothetical protein
VAGGLQEPSGPGRARSTLPLILLAALLAIVCLFVGWRLGAQHAAGAPGPQSRGPPAAHTDVPRLVGTLPVFPGGRGLDAGLSSRLVADLDRPENDPTYLALRDGGAAGVYVDLIGDGSQGFVLLTPEGGLAYQNYGGSWELVGRVHRLTPATSWPLLKADLVKGAVATKPPRWRELWVGQQAFRIDRPQ